MPTLEPVVVTDGGEVEGVDSVEDVRTGGLAVGTVLETGVLWLQSVTVTVVVKAKTMRRETRLARTREGQKSDIPGS